MVCFAAAAQLIEHVAWLHRQGLGSDPKEIGKFCSVNLSDRHVVESEAKVAEAWVRDVSDLRQALYCFM